jgi:DNA-binding transcriptional ArsR family regulator
MPCARWSNSYPPSGPLDELRSKRVDAALHEILARLRDLGAEPTRAEEFANLFEKVLPKLARAASNAVRERFRDLLVNAAQVPTGDHRWGQANLAEQILSELDEPAITILTLLVRANTSSYVDIVSAPVPQVVPAGSFQWQSPQLGCHPIGADWPVVEEWLRRLRETRLIIYRSHDGRGAFGEVRLAQLGQLLVDWVLAVHPPNE